MRRSTKPGGPYDKLEQAVPLDGQGQSDPAVVDDIGRSHPGHRGDARWWVYRVTAASATTPKAKAPKVLYYMAMGDSLGAGQDASSPSTNYVSDLYRHELTRYPNLQLLNLYCGGATTSILIHGQAPRDAHSPPAPSWVMPKPSSGPIRSRWPW
jgi:hypothetical protein